MWTWPVQKEIEKVIQKFLCFRKYLRLRLSDRRRIWTSITALVLCLGSQEKGAVTQTSAGYIKKPCILLSSDTIQITFTFRQASPSRSCCLTKKNWNVSKVLGLQSAVPFMLFIPTESPRDEPRSYEPIPSHPLKPGFGTKVIYIWYVIIFPL